MPKEELPDKHPDFPTENEDEQPNEVQQAFAEIRGRIDEQLTDCDEKLGDITSRLPQGQPPRQASSPKAYSGAGSWRILLAFGVSFAVRVGLLGIVLGGWVDKRFLGGTGIGAAVIILLVIIYSFCMLYHDVMQQYKIQQNPTSPRQKNAENPPKTE